VEWDIYVDQAKPIRYYHIKCTWIVGVWSLVRRGEVPGEMD